MLLKVEQRIKAKISSSLFREYKNFRDYYKRKTFRT